MDVPTALPYCPAVPSPASLTIIDVKSNPVLWIWRGIFGESLFLHLLDIGVKHR